MHHALLDLGLSPLAYGVARAPRGLVSAWQQQLQLQQQQQHDTTRVYVHLTLEQQHRLKEEESNELLQAAAADEAAEVSLRACDFRGAPPGVPSASLGGPSLVPQGAPGQSSAGE